MKKKMLKVLLLAVLSLTVFFALTITSSAAFKGDVNGDRTIDSDDARTVLRAAVEIEMLDEAKTAIADVDEDGEISSNDARTILRTSVGLETTEHFYTKETIREATCTQTVLYLRTCTECSDSYEEEGAALGHVRGEVQITVEVTCETDGLEEYVCERCGDTEQIVVPAGHIWNPAEATCTKDQYCTRGNHIGTPALGHTTTWGKCNTCKIFVTDKYAEQAAIIKTNCNTGVREATTGYSYIEKSIGSAYSLKSLAAQAKPYYERSKQAYQAAYNACGDIAEFAAIKSYLSTLIANTDKILAQIAVISSVSAVDDSNYFALIEKVDDPQWANDRVTSNLLKKITW